MSAGRHRCDEGPKVIKLKIMIDKKSNQVIFAESDHEFIDTLFSFLTLPLGTVIKLLEYKMVQLGSISCVYASVNSLEPRFLRTSYCKSMLIMPRNASEVQCEKLKLNVDYSENAGKLFDCNSYNPRCKNIFSISQNTQCFHCNRLRQFDRIINEKEEKRSCGGESVVEVFLKGGAASFLITDDLQVIPASTASLTALFRKLGVSDKSEIEAKTVEVDTEEVFQLLKFSLLSKTALTNTVLNSQGRLKDILKYEDNQTAKLGKKTTSQNTNQTAKSDKKTISQNTNQTAKSDKKTVSQNTNQTAKSDKKTKSQNTNQTAKLNKETTSQNTNTMSLKLIVSKIKKEVLYAEAGVKLVDFLFSFLVFPLGAVVKHLGGNSRLGCIDNLYKGAADLSSENYIKSEECKNMLLSPKLFPHSGFDSHILEVEEEYPKYRYDDSGCIELVRNTNKSKGSLIVNEEEASDLAINILDPKSPTGETIKGEGYLKGPATFMIMDNLLVTPFSPTALITLLNQKKVPTSDVEERTVTVGKDEALILLKASLISETVLNDVFDISEPYPKVMLKV